MNAISVERRKLRKPASLNTSARRASPACAEGEPAVLRERVRAAQRGRGGVVEPPSFEPLGSFDAALPDQSPFQAQVVALAETHTPTASGLPNDAHRTIDSVERTDIVIVPSMMVEGGKWHPGRYPAVVRWLEGVDPRSRTESVAVWD